LIELPGGGTLSGAGGSTTAGGLGANNCGSGTLAHGGDVSCDNGSGGGSGYYGGGAGASNAWILTPGGGK